MSRTARKGLSLILSMAIIIPIFPGKVCAESEAGSVSDDTILTEITTGQVDAEAYLESESADNLDTDEADESENEDTSIFSVEGIFDIKTSNSLTETAEEVTEDFESEEDGELSAQSDDSTVTWTLDDDGTLTISGSGAISDTSWDADSVVSLVIEDGVTSIPSSTFYGYKNLTSVVLPESMTSIGNYAFYNCKKLASINIPSGVNEIGGYAFEYCTALTEAVIAAKSIGYRSFAGCSSLVDLTLLEGVESIGDGCFDGCAMENVVFPESLTNLGAAAMQNCAKIKAVTIPESVTQIKRDAFEYCSSLESVTIPNTVTRIGYEAFEHCTALTEITIPESVTYIDYRAFQYCENLEKVSLLSPSLQLGMKVFVGCDKLQTAGPTGSDCSYEFAWTETIPDYAFDNMAALTEATLPEGITEIGIYAFSVCTGLKDLAIPESVTKIDNYAFNSCTGFTSVDIPNGVTSIGEGVFSYCTGLVNVALPNGLTAISCRAFSGCTGMKNITLPESLTNIDTYAFENCTALTNITIPSGVTKLGTSVFSGCTALTEVNYSDTMKQLGANTFDGCTSLKEIYLPEGLEYLGGYTFRNCKSVEKIIWNGVDIYDSGISGHRIYGSTFQNVGANTDGVELIFGDKVQIIPKDAFSTASGNNAKLTDVTIQSSVTSIEERAFYGQQNIDELSIPDSVESIGDEAFANMGDVVLYVVPGSCAYEYAAANGMDFVDMYMKERAVLTVYDSDGKMSKDEYTVRWYSKDSGAVLASGTTFLGYDEEQEFEYEVIPLNDGVYSYYSSGRQQFTPSESDGTFYAEYVMQPIDEISVSGAVTTKNGDAVCDATVDLVQNYGQGRTKTISATTDKNGEYTASLMNVSTTAICAADEYYTASTELIKSRADASACRFPAIVLESMPKNKISLSMKLVQAAKEGEEVSSSAITNFNNMTFEVYDETTQREVNIKSQYPNLYPTDGDVNAGDTVTIKAVSKDYGEAETSAVMSSDVSADAAVSFTQNGAFTAKVNKSAVALAFNAEGAFAGKYSGESEISSESIPNGDYTVVFLANSGYMPQVSSIEKLAELGLSDSDYTKKTVTINQGIISDVGNIDVPDFDVSKLYYTVDEETYCMTNKTTASTGEFVSVRVGYEIDSRYNATDEIVTVELPAAVSPIQNSLTVNGEKADYTVTDNGIEISVGKASAVIKFYVMADTAGDYDIDAYLNAKIDAANVTQPIGAASVNISNVTCTLPKKTGRTAVTVSGKAVAKSKVTIYDNNEQVAETTANSAGTWSVQYTLATSGDTSSHDVYAVVETQYGVEYRSDTQTLEYDKNYCEVERVTMINTAHGPSSLDPIEVRTVFEFLQPDTNNHTYDYYPKYPEFTFVVETTGDNAEKVQVITKNSYGDSTYIDCKYDAVSGNWIGTHKFESFSYVPCSVSAVLSQAETNCRYQFKGTGTASGSTGGNDYAPKKTEYTEPSDDMIYSVSSVHPQKGSTGRVTLKITGTLLEPNLSAVLTDGEVSYAAEKIYWKNHECVYATFDLASASDGVFTLDVTGGGEQASLENCFTIDSSLEKGKLEYSVNMNKAAATGKECKGSITAVNTGYTDVYSPVFELNGSNVEFKQDESKDYAETLNIFLENGEGLAGIIANGETAGSNFSYKIEQDGAFALNAYDCSGRSGNIYENVALDTQSSKSEILTANVLSLMGNTYRQYSESAAKMASAIDAANDADITLDVIETAYEQLAYGHIGNTDIDSAADLASLALSVARTFVNTSYCKADTGMFGRGWRSGYDIKAEYSAEDDAEIIVIYSADAFAVYTKDEDGVFRSELSKTSTASRDEDGNIAVKFDNGKVTLFNADGFPVKTTDIYGNEINYVYTDGEITNISDSRGDEITFEYTDGKVTAVSSSATGDSAAYTYDGDYLMSVTTKYGTTSYSYDLSSLGAKRGTLTSVTNAAAITSRFSYDSIGRVIKITTGDSYINYNYGLNDVTATDSEGNTERRIYDLAGNVTYLVNSDGSVSYAEYTDYELTSSLSEGLTTKAKYTYDDKNRIVRVTAPNGINTDYSYDEKGGLTGVNFAEGRLTKYNRSENGELTDIVYSDGGTEKYTYSDTGDVASFAERDGQTVTYTYDSAGNITKETYSSGHTRSFTYDKYGNVLTVSEDGSVTEMSYNDKGDIAAVKYPDGKSVSYGYDEAGRRTSFTDNEGNVTNYAYDGNGNLASVSDGGNIIIRYEYNTDGTIKKQTNANGTYTEYSYSGGRLSAIANYKSDGTSMSSYEYAYNENGYISSVTSGRTIENYVYDKLGQLTEVTSSNGTVTSYEYDAAGNRIQVSTNDTVTEYAADEMNRYTNVGDFARTYDDNGRLVSEETADGTTLYEWDYMGRLAKLTDADGIVYEYEYDAFSNRSAVTVDGDRTEYLNDPTGYGFAAAQYHDGEVTRYILANGLAAQEKNGAEYFYNYNHLGSTTEITDSTGAVVNKYRYSHTGEVLTKTEGIENPFTYVGMGGIMDDGTGLWYDRARYVSQSSGSFISPDPAGQAYDLNMYRYAGNNPVNYVDYSGKCPVVAVLALPAAVVVADVVLDAAMLVGCVAVGLWALGALYDNPNAVPPVNGLSGDFRYTPKKNDGNNGNNGNNGNKKGGKLVVAVEGLQSKLKEFDPEFPLVGTIPTYAAKKLNFVASVAGILMLGSALSSAPAYAETTDHPVTPKADPSGYVYAGVASNRLEGVTTTIYYEGYPLDEFGEPDYDAGLQTLEWTEAADYNEINPQTTDTFGRYGWDTPEGKWRVEFGKDGYETVWSDWMEVPPEYTDVNINMMTTTAPELETVNIYSDKIELRFSQYMDIDSVTSSAVTVNGADGAVSGTVAPANAEYNYEQTAQYASVFEFVPETSLSGDISVNVSGVKNYAGIAMTQAKSESAAAKTRPENIGIDTEHNVSYGESLNISMQIYPGEAGAGKKLLVTSYSPSIASVEQTEVTADENGQAEVTVRGALPGTAVMSVKIAGTDISEEFTVVVENSTASDTISVTAEGRYNTENLLIAALCEADGTLITMKTKHPNGSGSDTFEFERTSESAYVKIMEWDSLEGMNPEKDAETVYVDTVQ